MSYVIIGTMKGFQLLNQCHCNVIERRFQCHAMTFDDIEMTLK
jgi:hypothetical protein